MDVKKILVNMAVLGLLVFGIMAFTVITQSDNEVAYPITNNTLINNTYGYLESNLTATQTQAQKSLNASEDNIPTEQIGELDVSTTISATRTAKSIIIGLWNIYVKLPMTILGVSPVVANVISAILLIFLVIGVWAIWKGVISS